jgi:sortase A
MMGAVDRAVRILSVALITAGLVVLADAGITLAWREPVSSLYGSIQQREAEDDLEALEREFPTRADLRAAARATDTDAVAALARRFAARVSAGDAIGRISIPAIDLDIVMVEGTDTPSLQKGPGRYADTAFPGQVRTIGVAGHRTTYLAPFRRLDELEAGDQIAVEMPYASFAYRVQGTRVVEPADVGVVRDVGYERLVLTACHPLYSASQRIVAFARLSEVSFFAAGAGRWNDP